MNVVVHDCLARPLLYIDWPDLARRAVEAFVSAIAGVFVAAITPRRESGHQIDLGATLDIVDFLSSTGVDGIALLGSTGEFLHFDIEDRVRLTGFASRRSRVPLLVNVSHSTLDGAITLAEEAASAGAAGLLLMPPYYFRYSQESIRAFYLEFAEELGRSTPIFLYNIPVFTNDLSIESASALLETGLFAGIKDSSGSREYCDALLTLRRQGSFTLLVGNDGLFPRARVEGADGVVSGVASAVPELMVGLERAIKNRDQGQSERLTARLTEFIAQIDRFPAPIGVIDAAGARGLKVGPVSIPLGQELERQREEFRAWFRAWLPEVQQESQA